MKEYQYLLEKIKHAKFYASPFKHILIDNFLSEEHLNLLIKSPQIKLPIQNSSKDLIDTIINNGYEVQKFPGCIENIDLYLKCLDEGNFPKPREMLEGFGITFRLKKYEDKKIEQLVNFLNSMEFKKTLEEKFEITRPNRIETAIQKNLTGYEISPHPDVRFKCLTYLLNINTDVSIDNDMDMHTHLLRFKKEKEYIKDFWKHNQNYNTDWVPWDWCETEKICNLNNSIVLFRPDCDTLHGVKLKYDHCKFQRTQLYGNLWYEDSYKVKKLKFDQIPIP